MSDIREDLRRRTRLAVARGAGGRLLRVIDLFHRAFEGAFEFGQQHLDEAAPLLARELGATAFFSPCGTRSSGSSTGTNR